MASPGYIDSLLGNLTAEQRLTMKNVFTYVLRNLRFGRPSGPSENFSGAYVSGTTSSVSGREVVIPHKMERAPYTGIPVLDFQTVGSEIVALQVTRVSDGTNIYLASAETDVPFTLYCEG